jgi:hypothetical protein
MIAGKERERERQEREEIVPKDMPPLSYFLHLGFTS